MAKPKLLLDENIGSITAAFLHAKKYDVVAIGGATAGLPDEAILAQAFKEKRIMITLDKDFGQLVHQYKQRHAGVVFLRMRKESPERIHRTIFKILMKYGDRLQGKFVTASEWSVKGI